MMPLKLKDQKRKKEMEGLSEEEANGFFQEMKTKYGKSLEAYFWRKIFFGLLLEQKEGEVKNTYDWHALYLDDKEFEVSLLLSNSHNGKLTPHLPANINQSQSQSQNKSKSKQHEQQQQQQQQQQREKQLTSDEKKKIINDIRFKKLAPTITFIRYIFGSMFCCIFLLMLISAIIDSTQNRGLLVYGYYILGCSCSICGCLYVIFTYRILDKTGFNRHPASLIYYSTWCDLVLAITVTSQALFNTHHNKYVCDVAGYVYQYFQLCALIYYFLLSLDLLLCVMQQFVNTKLNVGLYKVVANSIAAASCVLLLPIIPKQQAWCGESATGLCWVKSNRSAAEINPGNWMLYFIPFGISFAFSVFVLIYSYLLISQSARRKNSNRDKFLSDQGQYIIAFGTYYFVVFALYVYLTNSFIYNSNDGQVALPIVVFYANEKALKMFAFINSSRGVLDALIWYLKSKAADSEGEAIKEIAKILRNDVINIVSQGIVHSAELTFGMINSDIPLSDIELSPNNFQAEYVIHYQGKNTNAEVIFKTYAGLVFTHIRQLYGISTKLYIESMKLESDSFYKESFSEGASGSFLYFTQNEKFVVKTTTEGEKDKLLEILPSYHKHFAANPDTLLVKFYGLHSLKMYNRTMYFVVMSNVHDLAPTRRGTIEFKFDLKGSKSNRGGKSKKNDKSKQQQQLQQQQEMEKAFKSREKSLILLPKNNTQTVFKTRDKAVAIVSPKDKVPTKKDNDFREYLKEKDHERSYINKITMDDEVQKKFVEEISKDTEFCKSHNIMDYSLLIGISRHGKYLEEKELKSFQQKEEAREKFAKLCFACGNRQNVDQVRNVAPFWTKSDGGIKDVVHTETRYYFGIIDILQEYNLQKVLENFYKIDLLRKNDISAIPPAEYQSRFVNFVDYRTKKRVLNNNNNNNNIDDNYYDDDEDDDE